MIVCDTNVLLSALLFPGGLPDRIFQRILSRRLPHAASPEILTEVQRILARKFPGAQERIPQVLALITEVSRIVYPTTRIEIITADPSDNRILECAVATKAQFIISGDKKHVLPVNHYQGIHIVSPRQFFALAAS